MLVQNTYKSILVSLYSGTLPYWTTFELSSGLGRVISRSLSWGAGYNSGYRRVLGPVEDCFQTLHNLFIPSELIAA